MPVRYADNLAESRTTLNHNVNAFPNALRPYCQFGLNPLDSLEQLLPVSHSLRPIPGSNAIGASQNPLLGLTTGGSS